MDPGVTPKDRQTIWHAMATSADPAGQGEDPQAALSQVIAAVETLAGIRDRLGRTEPDVRT